MPDEQKRNYLLPARTGSKDVHQSASSPSTLRCRGLARADDDDGSGRLCVARDPSPGSLLATTALSNPLPQRGLVGARQAAKPCDLPGLGPLMHALVFCEPERDPGLFGEQIRPPGGDFAELGCARGLLGLS